MNLLLSTFLKPTVLYMSHMEEEKQLPAAAAGKVFVDLCYRRLAEATQGLNVPKIFHDLGYVAPKEAKLRVPFQFVPPHHQVEGDHAPSAAKPKPKAAPRQLTMSHQQVSVLHDAENLSHCAIVQRLLRWELQEFWCLILF